MTPGTILLSLGLGIAFGAIIQRVQASSPERIVDTLTLRDLGILKFMLLAIGVAAIGIGGLTAIGIGFVKVKPLVLLGIAVGGLVFGLGFAIAGYCPGTCLVGAAEGRRDALFTIAGGLLGALAYALVFPAAKPLLLEPLDFGKVTLATATGVAPGVAGAVFGAAVIAISFWLPTHPARRGT